MAQQYLNEEYRNMHFGYERTNKNAIKAPRFIISHAPAFLNTHKRLKTHDSIKHENHGSGNFISARPVEAKERTT